MGDMVNNANGQMGKLLIAMTAVKGAPPSVFGSCSKPFSPVHIKASQCEGEEVVKYYESEAVKAAVTKELGSYALSQLEQATFSPNHVQLAQWQWHANVRSLCQIMGDIQTA